MFRFRLLTTEDLPLMLEWLSKNHVKQWWNDGDDTLEKVAAHYGRKTEGMERFILIEVKQNVEKPIGYFQYYTFGENAIGIDQFIGEEDYINRGVGAKTIKLFIELIISRHNSANIVLDPSPENTRAIKCYQNVGFKHYETKINEDGRAAYMMRFEIPNQSV